jgi:uncharacterized protein YjbI with pentapeptide repeats
MLDRKLLEAEPGDPVHTLAQARTSTVILRLDAEYNESVIRFLGDSGLAGSDEASVSLLSEIALENATLSDALLPNADLRFANLKEADLSGADLRYADLRYAILVDADLSDAYLDKADLSGAEAITNKELDRQAALLKGATMPNGQKYEEWLKSKDRESDGQNSGTS